MKALAVMVLLRSGAREIKCKGCGRSVLVFDENQLTHEPPECAWFRTLMERNSADVDTSVGEIRDDTSN